MPCAFQHSKQVPCCICALGECYYYSQNSNHYEEQGCILAHTYCMYVQIKRRDKSLVEELHLIFCKAAVLHPTACVQQLEHLSYPALCQ